MPEDKDFKRLVRTRMQETGERYTRVRAQFRPEAPAPSVASNASTGPAELLGWTVPTDVDSLAEMRAQRDTWKEPRPPADPPWELTVLAGGPLDEVEGLSVPLTKVAALGASLQGVGYVAMGLDLVLLLSKDAIGERLARSLEGRIRARRAHSELLASVEDRTGLEVPPETHGSRFGTDRFRVSADEGGAERLEALTETGVMIRSGVDAVVDFAEVMAGTRALEHRVWVGYGVIVIVDRGFTERLTRTGDRPCYTLDVDTAFWNAAGDALSSAASAVHLPPWPLEEARLEALKSPARSWRRYRPQWGHFG